MTYSYASIMSQGTSKSYSSSTSPRRVSDDIASLDSWSDAFDLSSEQPLGPEPSSGSNFVKLTSKNLGHHDVKQGRRNLNILSKAGFLPNHCVPDIKHAFSPAATSHTNVKEVQGVMPALCDVPKILSPPLNSPAHINISDGFSINGDPSSSVSQRTSSDYSDVFTTRNVRNERTSCSVDNHPHVYKPKYRFLPQDSPQLFDRPHDRTNTDSRLGVSQHQRHSDSGRDQLVDGEKVKTKLMSAWNNMKYGNLNSVTYILIR